MLSAAGEMIILAVVLAAVLMGLGNTVGYHRLLTHRSFKARAPLRWVLTLLGALHSGSPTMLARTPMPTPTLRVGGSGGRTVAG